MKKQFIWSIVVLLVLIVLGLGYVALQNKNIVSDVDLITPEPFGIVPLSVSAKSGDIDSDGLSDADELWLADTWSPILYFDEEEGDCISNLGKVAIIYQVTPFYNNDKTTNGALITYVFLYPKDCGVISSGIGWDHNGDTEALRIYVKKTGTSSWKAGRVLMRRHDDYWRSYDTSDETEWRQMTPPFGKRTHMKVYVSESKHAMYPSLDACESYGATNWEDCGGGEIRKYSIIQCQNIGEKLSPAFDRLRDSCSEKLSGIYPKEYAFTVYDMNKNKEVKFCGNLGGSTCSGAIGGKWWPPNSTSDYRKQKDMFLP